MYNFLFLCSLLVVIWAQPDGIEFTTNDDETYIDPAIKKLLHAALKKKLESEKKSMSQNKHPDDTSNTGQRTTPKDSSAPTITSLCGCGLDDKDKGLLVRNCKKEGGQWLTISGANFGVEGAIVQLWPTKEPTKIVTCAFPRHWVSSPEQVLECRLPFAAPNTVFNVIVVTKSGARSEGLLDAVHYERVEESPLPDFSDFEAIGIGGLGKELTELKRKVFGTRKGDHFALLQKLGIRPVRGVLLYGPPGTGKTLVARKIAEVLQARTVKVVNGPEIMSKYVGESEANIRGLFHPAEQDFKQNGPEKCGLHVIVLDEMDAMLRHRGQGEESGARAVYDGVTTQLLAYMDGFHSLPNVLLVGLTNRLEGIDKALLRPGRFEIKLRLPLPDETARYEILRVHTKKLRDSNTLAEDVNLRAVAKMTLGFSGADIEGMVRTSISYGLERLSKDGEPVDTNLQVTQVDISTAVRDLYASQKVESYAATYITKGLISYSDTFRELILSFRKHLKHLETSPHTRTIRVLLEGKEGAGLTAVASYFAAISEFPMVRIITGASLLGKRPEEKLQAVVTAFEEALDVSAGIIVLDSVEQLLEYNPLGTRVNAFLLHELGVLLGRAPPRASPGKGKLLILMTTHVLEALNTLHFTQYDAILSVGYLTKADQFRFLKQSRAFESEAETFEVCARLPALLPVKKLVFVLDTARGSHVAHPTAEEDLASPYVPPALPSVSTKASNLPLFLTVQQFQDVQKEFGVYVEDVTGLASARANYILVWLPTTLWANTIDGPARDAWINIRAQHSLPSIDSSPERNATQERRKKQRETKAVVAPLPSLSRSPQMSSPEPPGRSPPQTRSHKLPLSPPPADYTEERHHATEVYSRSVALSYQRLEELTQRVEEKRLLALPPLDRGYNKKELDILRVASWQTIVVLQQRSVALRNLGKRLAAVRLLTETFVPLIKRHIRNKWLLRARKVLSRLRQNKHRPTIHDLKHLIAFQSWPTENIQSAINMMIFSMHRRGDYLAFDGEPCVSLGVLEMGTAEILLRKNEEIKSRGERNVVSTGSLLKGSFFGETSLFQTANHPVILRCTSPVHLWTLRRRDYLKAVLRVPRALRMMIGSSPTEVMHRLERIKEMDNDADVLHMTPMKLKEQWFFLQWSTEALSAVQQALQLRTFDIGDTICMAGRHAKNLYFVAKGRAKSAEEEGCHYALGDMIALDEVLFAERYRRTVVAETVVKVWSLENDTLRDILLSKPSLYQELLQKANEIHAKEQLQRPSLEEFKEICRIQDSAFVTTMWKLLVPLTLSRGQYVVSMGQSVTHYYLHVCGEIRRITERGEVVLQSPGTMVGLGEYADWLKVTWKATWRCGTRVGLYRVSISSLLESIEMNSKEQSDDFQGTFWRVFKTKQSE